MENNKNTEKIKHASEKEGSFQQSIISEQIKKRPINKIAFCSTMIYLLPQTFGSLALSAPTFCPDNLFTFVFTIWKRDKTHPIGKGR